MNRNTRDKNSILQQILSRFDYQDKESLATELVRMLSLERNGPPYQDQVISLLDRGLTEEEEFKLSVLNSAHNPIGGGSGGGCEEE